MENFRKLGLSEPFIALIEHARFSEPSEIQARTIPLALEGRDIIGGSATGSGKTLAFGASIIEKAVKGKGIQALILTPTRELAEQVGSVFKKFSTFKDLTISIVYGGVGISPQIDSLAEAEIVVGTPGRILDHMERGTIDLAGIKTLVLDEADRMLDMGFIDDVERIIDACPKQRQTLLFSATISPDISHIAQKHMHDPVDIAVESYVDASLLKQVYYDVPRDIKFSLLVHLLRKEKGGLVMVFCNTRTNTDFVADNLNRHQIEAMAIHGGLSQEKRNKIIQKFHSQNVYVLVCTDVAARGLDIKDVSHVYNYDIPKNHKEYIHRIGRTARAGREGIAVNLVSDRDYDNFRRVLEDDSIKIVQEVVPEVERVWFRIAGRENRRIGRDQDRRGGGYGGRSGFGGRGRREGGGGERRESSEGSSSGGEGRSYGRGGGRSYGGGGGRSRGGFGGGRGGRRY